MSIFKAYDIRGIYGKDLDEETARKIGRAYAKFANVKKVVVGRDCRPHSEPLFRGLAKGLTEAGCDVVDIGLASTPMTYFANGTLGADGSVMITASHNPAEWNGFKLCRAGAVPISGATGIKDIERMVVENDLGEPAATPGSIAQVDILSQYAAHVRSFAHLARPVHAALDFANGMGICEAASFKDTLFTYESLFGEFDGRFPNHEANPLHVETLRDLQEKVRSGNYDFGVSFDGDADRAGFVDEKGDIVPMDFITALVAKDLLAENPGATVFYDLRSSKVVPETIAAAGGKPMMSRVGHAFIKAQMRENNAIFAGELSGHYYFKANFTAESSSMAVFALANIVSRAGVPLSELVRPLRKYSQSGEINTKVSGDPAEVLARIKKNFEGKADRVFELDGVSVEFKDWWCNVRMSNTEPLVRLNLEADTPALMEEKRDELLAMIRA